jgi:O-antigen/teichoic acid export membrane protein
VTIKSVFFHVYNSYQHALSVSRFGTHVIITMATNLLQGMLTLFTGVMVARLLGPEGRGELAAIQSWAPFIATVAMLGLPEAVTYFSAQYPERARSYWVSGTCFALVVGIPFAMVGYWLMPWLLSAQAPSVTSVAQWYVVGLVFLFAFHSMPLASLRGRNDFAVWNVLQLVPTLGWLLVLFLAMVFKYTTAQFVALGYIAMLGLIFFPVGAVGLRRVPGTFRLDRHLFYPMMRYGLPLAIATLPQWLWNARLPQMFMATFLDLEPRSLGLFAVAAAWGSMAGPLINAVGVVLFPDVASKPSEDQKAMALARGLRIAVFLTVSLSVVPLLVTPYAVPTFFGEDFRPAVPAAMVMVVAGGIMGIKMILDQGLRGWGKSKVVLVGELIGLAATMLLLPSLLFRFNIIGAAISLLVGYAATTAYLVHKARRLAKESIQRLLWPNLTEIMTFLQRFRTISTLGMGDR